MSSAIDREPSLEVIEGAQSEVADFLHSKGAEIMGVRADGSVVGMVPTPLIDNEEVPVKSDYVKSLIEQMDREAAKRGGGDGQIAPVNLGLIWGVPLLKVEDGFHRSSAQEKRGALSIYSGTALTDWDGLYDTRIFTAKDHAQVRFSRVVIWMKEIWDITGYSEHMTLEQAVLLHRFDGSGKRLEVEPDVVEAAKDWVHKKEVQWDIAAMTIRQYIHISETVDPALVEATREKVSSHTLEAPTQDIIKVLSEEAPSNYELQNMIFEAAKAHNLKTELVRAVCKVVEGSKTNSEAAKRLKGIDWKELEPVKKKQGSTRMSQTNDPRIAGEKTLDASYSEIVKATTRIQRLVASGEPLTPEMRAKLDELETRIRVIQTSLSHLALRVDELQALPDAATEAAPADKAQPSAKNLITPRPVRAVPDLSKLPKPNAAEPAKPEEVTPPAKKAATPPPAKAAAKSTATPANKAAAPKKAAPAKAAAKPVANPPARKPESSTRLAEPSYGRILDANRERDAESFETALRDYLSGKSDEGPFIDTQSDARKAERILSSGGFAMADRVEEIRDEISDAQHSRHR